MNPSSKAKMLTIKTAQVQRKPASGAALLAAGLTFTGLAAVTVRATTMSWSSSTSSPTSRIEGEATFHQYAQVLNLLKRGDDGRARQMLDALQNEPLIVNAGGVGEGTMRSLSPSALLIHLTRSLGRRAERAARNGQPDEARQWLGYGYRIAQQVANTPSPNVDALTLAHCLDVATAQVEARTAAKSGDHSAIARAQERSRTFAYAWRDILPQLPERKLVQPGLELTSEADKLRLNQLRDRYCLYRAQAGVVIG